MTPSASGASAVSIAPPSVVPVIVISLVLVSAGMEAVSFTVRTGSGIDSVTVRSASRARKAARSRLPKRPLLICQSSTTYSPLRTVT